MAQGCVITLTQGHISPRSRSQCTHTANQSPVYNSSLPRWILDNISHNCCPWPKSVSWPWAKAISSRSQCTYTQNCIRTITSNCHVGSWSNITQSYHDLDSGSFRQGQGHSLHMAKNLFLNHGLLGWGWQFLSMTQGLLRGYLSCYDMSTQNSSKIFTSTLINLQNNTDVISRKTHCVPRTPVREVSSRLYLFANYLNPNNKNKTNHPISSNSHPSATAK